MRRLLAFALILFGISACGALYTAPLVDAAGRTNSNVRIIPITYSSLEQANSSPYQPRALPSVFSRTAGIGDGMIGQGALPDGVSRPEGPPPLALRPPPEIDPGPYTIGIGDVVLLSTPNRGSALEELSGLLAAQNSRQGYTVQDDGAINIPNIGRVRIAGLTIDEAENVLFQQLLENQFEPSFSLEITEFGSRRVSIGGAVGQPGVIPIGLNPLRLGDAIAMAGGVATSSLDYASIRIYRSGASYQIPVTRFYESAELLDLRLVDGDAIFVDSTYDVDQAAEYFRQQITLVQTTGQARASALSALSAEVALRRNELEEARANFRSRAELDADSRDYAYITGEVGNQTRIALPFETRATLADALFGEGGGIRSETGDVSQIYVLRTFGAQPQVGIITAWHLDARQATNLALMTAFELRPNDVIFVAQQPITRWNRAISQVLPSIFSAANVAGG